MFERRLRVLLFAFAATIVVIVVRLAELQIVRADYYRQRAERSLVLRPKSLPFVRGSILDRTGEVLVADQPCWDLKIDFDAIAADTGANEGASKRLLRSWRRAHPVESGADHEDASQLLRVVLDTMWSDIARVAPDATPISSSDLRERASRIHERISAIRAIVAKRRGFDAPVAEEREPHTILSRLDADRQIAARESLSRYPWLHVERSFVRRFTPGAKVFAHLLGRTGRVGAEDLERDPQPDDPFVRYRADETCGRSGVEWMSESTLRGRRGCIVRERDGSVVPDESVTALNGDDIMLTLHAPLQRRLYELLGETVRGVPASSGGAIVVLDVATREVLALVSYPAYDPNRFAELYDQLRDDTDRLPLRFRAVSNRYAPGSTVKPLVCLAGLMSGRIALDDREECTGYLLPDHRDRWRCWRIHGTSRRKAHGAVNVVEALTGSCNIYMYRLGERLTVDGLCSVFDMVGVGRGSGTGLREENPGINPTPSWLMTHKNARATPGMARLFAIGQGELSMTPIQVANLMATYASGVCGEVSIVRSADTPPKWSIPARPEHLRAIREGMYGVVNDRGGTAYKQAYFEHDRYALLGKTGSATAHPWPTSYRIPYTDRAGYEAVAIVPEGAEGPAVERFVRDHPFATFDPHAVEVASRWPVIPPDSGERHSHAWFGGFLQALDAARLPDWSKVPRVAFAVLVEFGGSGGRTSGPLAKRVAAELLDVLGPDLDADSAG